MARYLLRRVLLGTLSAVVTVALVMGVLYCTLDRNLIFASDMTFQRLSGNQKTVYQYRVWEEYGYLDYVPFADYLNELAASGTLSAERRTNAAAIGRTPDEDSPETADLVRRFTEEYARRGYTVVRLDARTDRRGGYQSGGQEQLFAWRDRPIAEMLMRYFSGIVQIDHLNRATGDVGERKMTFTLHDPVYGGKVLAPAVIGNGTFHRYLFYVDGNFPWLHQNFVTVRLGKSVSVNRGEDVYDTLNRTQGMAVLSETLYPTGYRELSADNLHTAVYVEGSLSGNEFNLKRYVDDYTSVRTDRSGMSRIGYSFVIGVLAVMLSYVLALPFSTLMAMHEGGLADAIGTAYIAFITAVPSLAYLFLFKAIGRAAGLPVTFSLENTSKVMFVMPVISIALPAAGRLMKWNRRFANDQMSEEYIQFARACGFSQRQILFSHVMRNASIPIVQGVPASILGALTGAIITERIYSVPGAGNLLTTAIGDYDNSVIVGLTFFYALITVLSMILGDLLMAAADPRISLVEGGR